ncbi:unnamed protein product, partial [Mesorhabditis belari]|uniref:UVR domain-containing protein n=1 Tax=Mesorhabditis belari TaxID=2138241 RepID=A0AAF3J5U2_9BILA
MSELDFRVIEVNKQNDFDEIPPQLLVTKEWISERDCEFPQTLLIETRRRANVEKLQILVHNSYIPRKVVIETNRTSILQSDDRKHFTKLGEVSFKEKKSSATKHELKTVYMDEKLSRIRLKIDESYVNRVSNPYNQVGLIQLKIFGLYVPDEPENFSFKYIDERQKIGDAEGGLHSSSEIVDNKYTEELLELGRILEKNKKRCVQEENFKKAKEAQLSQRLLKKATKEMEELEKDKNAAIQDEDFQRAQDLKDEMKTLRGNVLASIDPRFLEYVPNDPGPSSLPETPGKPSPLYDHSGTAIPPPKLFKPIELSPRNSVQNPPILRVSQPTPLSHSLPFLSTAASDPFPPTPREDREKLSFSPREPTPKPKGDLPIRSPVGSRSPKPPTAPIRSPTPIKSPVRTQQRGTRSPPSHSSSHRRPPSLDSPVDFRRLPTTAQSPDHDYYETKRPATRESYIPAGSLEKPRTRTGSNRFYEKENMVVPAALRNRRSSDPEMHRRPNDHREDKSGHNEHGFLEAVHPSDRSTAQRSIQKFGLSTVQKIYSKDYNKRRDGLTELQKRLEDYSGKGSKSSEALDAALPLLTRCLRDALYSVYSSALDVFRYIGHDFIPESQLEKSAPPKMATACAEPLISALGNLAKDQRFVSETEDVLTDVLSTDPKMNKAFMAKFLAPFESGTQKSDRPRARIVLQQAAQYEVPNDEAGFNEKPIARFSISAMKHSDSEVKNIGKELFLMTYEHGDRKTLRRLLPDDTPSTRNPVYRQLHGEIKEIDGEERDNSRRSNTRNTRNTRDGRDTRNTRTSSSTGARDESRDQRKTSSSTHRGSTSADGNRGRSAERGRRASEKKPLKSNLRPPRIKDDSEEIDLDKVCMFCGQYNDEWNSGEKFDAHYLNDCPMLRKCDKCNEVLEISSLKEHYLLECVGKDSYRQLSITLKYIYSVSQELPSRPMYSLS